MLPEKRLQQFLRAPGGRAGLALGTAAAAALVAAPWLPAWLLIPAALGLGIAIWLAVTSQSLHTDTALRESERKFRGFVEQSLVGLYMVQDGRIVYANPKTAELVGYETPEQLLGMPVEALTAPEDVPLLLENHRRRLSGEVPSVRYAYRALRRDGRRVWVQVHGSACEYRGRPAVMGIGLDVSQQVEFERQSRLANRVFESASEGIVITDAEYRIEAVNPAFTRITGYEVGEAVGKVSRMLTGQGAYSNQEMLARLTTDGRWEGEMSDRRKNGEWYPAWLSISTVRDADGHLTNYVGVFTDNTRRKEAETRLQFLANHDTLTSMLNRSGMMLRFEEVIARARRDGRRLALLFVDLDRFKTVNDTLGHTAGDRLIAVAAERIRAE
ncbi:MAG TPA: PAS domain S-box protein, partial [Noviherbaspirillum sp.]|nr:PAS domain S-box protein [Noviherbaspirillum sp.]